MSGSTLKPYNRYRPIKTKEEGGSVESLGVPKVIYATTEIYENQISAIVKRESDIQVRDIIEFTETKF